MASPLKVVAPVETEEAPNRMETPEDVEEVVRATQAQEVRPTSRTRRTVRLVMDSPVETEATHHGEEVEEVEVPAKSAKPAAAMDHPEVSAEAMEAMVSLMIFPEHLLHTEVEEVVRVKETMIVEPVAPAEVDTGKAAPPHPRPARQTPEVEEVEETRSAAQVDPVS